MLSRSHRPFRPIGAAITGWSLLVAALTLGFVAPVLPVASASAAPPAETTPPSAPPADSSGDAAASAPGQVELVQSWTLTAGGGPDGSEIGSRPNLTYQLAPGAVVNDSVVVFNLGNVPMEFRVYATDAFNNDDGQFDLIPGDQGPVDAGAWVELVQETILLEPGKQATIPFTLTVPIDARPGDHVGAIVAGNVAQSDGGASADGQSAQVVNVERRTGTRLYVQVDGPLEPALAVSGLTTKYDHSPNPLGGSAEVSFVVQNTGNVRLGGTPVVSVGGPFGIGKQEIELPEIAELLPGQEIDFTTVLDGVPALFLDTTSVRIETDDATQRADAEAVETTARSFVPPITVLLVLALLALVVLGRRTIRRRRTAALPIAPISRNVHHIDIDREPQHQ